MFRLPGVVGLRHEDERAAEPMHPRACGNCFDSTSSIPLYAPRPFSAASDWNFSWGITAWPDRCHRPGSPV